METKKITITHYTKYSSPRRFTCSPNRFGQAALTSYGRANLKDGRSIEIENPDFGRWSEKDNEISEIVLQDKLERYPLQRIS